MPTPPYAELKGESLVSRNDLGRYVIGSLCNHVFETRTATESELYSLLT